MSRTRSRITTGLATALTATAFVSPGADASEDLRSPDARDAAVNAETGSYTPGPGRYVDLRSPDAQDAVVNPQTHSYSSAPVSDNGSGGTSWDTVGIVFGGVLSLCLVAFGLVLMNRRRNASQKSRIPATSS